MKDLTKIVLDFGAQLMIFAKIEVIINYKIHFITSTFTDNYQVAGYLQACLGTNFPLKYSLLSLFKCVTMLGHSEKSGTVCIYLRVLLPALTAQQKR